MSPNWALLLSGALIGVAIFCCGMLCCWITVQRTRDENEEWDDEAPGFLDVAPGYAPHTPHPPPACIPIIIGGWAPARDRSTSVSHHQTVTDERTNDGKAADDGHAAG